MTGLVHLQNKAYLYCKKEKKEAWTFPYPNYVSMADAMLLYFLHTIHFLPLIWKETH